MVALPPRRRHRRALPRPDRRAQRRDRRARGPRRGLAGATQIRARISALRHDLLHIRRTLAPDARRRAPGRRRPDRARGGRSCSRATSSSHFADAYDKLLRATDGLELSRDLLAGVRDYRQAKIANDQNEVMKRLTVIASILLVPTFIVGLYGQNFRHIPELAWGFGYWWSWALDHRDDGRPARVLPAQALALAHGAGTTMVACRTSSARTARSARSTTTGARA